MTVEITTTMTIPSTTSSKLPSHHQNANQILESKKLEKQFSPDVDRNQPLAQKKYNNPWAAIPKARVVPDAETKSPVPAVEANPKANVDPLPKRPVQKTNANASVNVAFGMRAEPLPKFSVKMFDAEACSKEILAVSNRRLDHEWNLVQSLNDLRVLYIRCRNLRFPWPKEWRGYLWKTFLLFDAIDTSEYYGYLEKGIHPQFGEKIDLDVDRTMRPREEFSSTEGKARLSRILNAFVWHSEGKMKRFRFSYYNYILLTCFYFRHWSQH